MKAAVLLLWGGCLLSIALSLIHLAWTASAWERVTVLAVLAIAVCSARRCST